MTLISVIICLIFERFLSSLHTIRNFHWLESLALGMAKSASEKSLVKNLLLLILLIALPVIVVTVIDIQLHYIFVPLEFLFSTAILFYSLGPETFYDRLKSFCSAKQAGDQESANWYVEKIVRRQLSSEEKENTPAVLIHDLFPLVNDRIFAPVFWYCLLGPTGAIAYRCVSRIDFAYANSTTVPSLMKRSAAILISIVNWMPARVTGLGFMLVGNFADSLGYCRHMGLSRLFKAHQIHSQALLRCLGNGSISLPKASSHIQSEHIAAAASLIRRNFELWLGVLAILTLLGRL